MFMTTQYTDMDSYLYYFKTLKMGYEWLSIDNSHFILQGAIISTVNQYINLNITNTLFDMHKAQGGIQIDQS